MSSPSPSPAGLLDGVEWCRLERYLDVLTLPKVEDLQYFEGNMMESTGLGMVWIIVGLACVLFGSAFTDVLWLLGVWAGAVIGHVAFTEQTFDEAGVADSHLCQFHFAFVAACALTLGLSSRCALSVAFALAGGALGALSTWIGLGLFAPLLVDSEFVEDLSDLESKRQLIATFGAVIGAFMMMRARNAAVTVVTTLIGAICISVGVGMLINGVPAAATTVKWSLYSSFYEAGVVVLVILFRFTACERITKRDPVLIMT